MTTRPWHPITPLQPQSDRDFSQDDDLRLRWLEHRSNAGDADLTELHRSWAIETGIIEGIYQLDEAQTRTLIEQGFEPSAIPPSGTGQDPDNLLAILQDHMTALDAIYSGVRRERSIGRTAIRQLHQVIVAHQPTYRAMNQFGQRFDATLHAGTFKTMPNNPTRPDGVLHVRTAARPRAVQGRPHLGRDPLPQPHPARATGRRRSRVHPPPHHAHSPCGGARPATLDAQRARVPLLRHHGR